MTVLTLDRITSEARRINLARMLLTAVAAVLYGFGWTARTVLGGVWFGVTWCVAAVKVGWIEAGDRGTA